MAERKSGRGFWGAFRHAFAVPAQERLTPWEHECLCKLAHKVVERGLTAPAILMLESARPLNYLGAHAILFFKPIISLVFAPGALRASRRPAPEASGARSPDRNDSAVQRRAGGERPQPRHAAVTIA